MVKSKAGCRIDVALLSVGEQTGRSMKVSNCSRAITPPRQNHPRHDCGLAITMVTLHVFLLVFPLAF